jgi:DNA modification methylase
VGTEAGVSSLSIVQGDARKLDGVADGSVAAIITSPPYPGQRVYEDDGKPIAGQIGAEPHPQEYLENLWACCKEWWRVLDDRGSLFVNLGDKRAASGAPGTTSGLGSKPQGKRTGIDSGYSRSHFGRPKSRQMIPERFAIGCEDGLADPEGIGWIVRQVIVWSKLNGLPESVGDRTRDDFEVLYHLVKSERYYSAVDELREVSTTSPLYIHGNEVAPKGASVGPHPPQSNISRGGSHLLPAHYHPLGRLPGSVWRIATEPLSIPGWAKAKYNLPSHFAAWPTEIPRRLILGWSPPAICLICGEGRWPVVEKTFYDPDRPQYQRALELAREKGLTEAHIAAIRSVGVADTAAGAVRSGGRFDSTSGHLAMQAKKALGGYYRELCGSGAAMILGYACSCCPTHIETETTLTHEAKECDGLILVPTGVVDIWGDDRLEERPCTDPAHMTETTKHVTVYDLAGWTPPADRPALILDPFCGTGTTALVAQALGRDALGVDLSSDYVRLAKWRCSQPSQAAKAKARTWGEAQGSLAL